MTGAPPMPLHTRITHGVAAGAVGVAAIVSTRGTDAEAHQLLVFILAAAATRLALGLLWIRRNQMPRSRP